MGDILELADVRLNETSPTAVDGGAGALRAPRIPHRLMGLKLRLIIDSTNVNENPRRRSTRASSVVSVKHAPTAERLGASAEVVYLAGEPARVELAGARPDEGRAELGGSTSSTGATGRLA